MHEQLRIFHGIALLQVLVGQISSTIMVICFNRGPIQFEIMPFNTHEYDHDTETDWAKKGDCWAAQRSTASGLVKTTSVCYSGGRLFPYRIGGLSEIENFDAKRRLGTSHLLMRGDGRPMGWFVCERLVRAHTFLTEEGIGQQIAFECSLARVPIPSQDGYWASVTSSVIAGNP